MRTFATCRFVLSVACWSCKVLEYNVTTCIVEELGTASDPRNATACPPTGGVCLEMSLTPVIAGCVVRARQASVAIALEALHTRVAYNITLVKAQDHHVG